MIVRIGSATVSRNTLRRLIGGRRFRVRIIMLEVAPMPNSLPVTDVKRVDASRIVGCDNRMAADRRAMCDRR
jgi:hypothetical protein